MQDVLAVGGVDLHGAGSILIALRDLVDVAGEIPDLLGPLLELVFVSLRRGGRGELKAAGARLLANYLHGEDVKAFG